ncbi:hypothetical protein MOV08_07580 [Streptomyces yunnanensis]|uniref:HEAT repeat-containing protein n=1 Tax=Streptomyces yunnanensis TaxID=156453 RepID=A0ABY8A2P4_9ACTN|nr:hypothetical protein [Streptomyces yunnanensis]WEB39163.1 hypothetical protein MOV08_07580 [Streptomyces yunnanensis]
MPDEALNALAEAARTGDDEQEAQHIAESAALLLSDESAPVRSRLLRGLFQILRDGPSGRRLALHAFVLACTRADNRLMLRWYTAAASAGPAEDAQQLSLLWRTALGDLGYTADALKALAGWVREADGDPQAERELAMLLPALVGSDEDRKRLDHMLLTLRGRRGSADAPPAVASRLRGVL